MTHKNMRWFGRVDDFVEPLIKYFQPIDGKTTRETYDSLGGRVHGALNIMYGDKDSIEKFVELCDKYGFDNIITDIYTKNIKTIGRWKDYLNNYEIKESRNNYGHEGPFWYFTTHGVGPGSIPKDVNVLDIQDGQNDKGTWGTFIALDSVLTTNELKYYDLIELSPKQLISEENR